MPRRTACDSGGHKENGPKPVSERLSGLVKDRVGSHRGLMPTVGTLIVFARLNKIGALVAAARTVEAIRPFVFNEISKAIFLCTKPPPKLTRRHGRIHGFLNR